MKPKNVVLNLIIVWLFVVLFTACGSSVPNPNSPTKTPLFNIQFGFKPAVEVQTEVQVVVETPTPNSLFKIQLWCPDCADAGMQINLWDKPGDLISGAKTVAQRNHGVTCDVLEERMDWYRVKCGVYTGWIKISLTHKL